jgi:hypothetical protein
MIMDHDLNTYGEMIIKTEEDLIDKAPGLYILNFLRSAY